MFIDETFKWLISLFPSGKLPPSVSRSVGERCLSVSPHFGIFWPHRSTAQPGRPGPLSSQTCGRTRDFALHRDDVKISSVSVSKRKQLPSASAPSSVIPDPTDLLRGRRTDGSQTKRQRDANNDFNAAAPAAACRSTLLRRGNFLFLFRRGRGGACSSEFNANLLRTSDS